MGGQCCPLRRRGGSGSVTAFVPGPCLYLIIIITQLAIVSCQTLTTTPIACVPPNCTDIDECSSSPCQNGGTCHDGQGSFSCSCPVGFSGPTCEEAIDECASSPCLGGGTCIDGIGMYTCQCPKGLVGPNCSRDLKECLSSPCLHGGLCIEMEGSFECNCTKGWSGRFCEYDVDECETASCQNDGRCEDEIAGYKCHCPQPWSGPNCEVNSKPCASPRACLNNGTCIDHRNGNYSCQCVAGFSGRRCEVDLDDCVSDPCINGGTCEDRPGGFHCHCLDEFGGVTCSAPYDACNDSPCHNGATCRSTPPHRNFTCACAMGFAGDQCEIDEDDCLGVTCPAGQVCFDLPASHRCGCPHGYEGDACDREINECAASPCLHGGTCVDGVGNATCLCLTGFRGLLCEHDVDECSEGGRSPCFSGICQNTVGSFQCWCRPGYTGTLCDQEYNECLVHPCRNGGTCRDLVANYKCLCPLGYAGKDCEIDVNECATQPCLNNATCLDEVGRFECRCQPGFAGILCEENVDECASSPCLNGGQCHDRINGFDCNCTDTGFSGPNCEVNIDDCASSPCMHDSNCTDLVKNYSCACYPGFQGKNCESDVPECSTGPCQNGGECLEKSNHTIYQLDDYHRPPGFPAGPYTYATAGGYLCLCPRGFTGTDCEVNIDDCASSPCRNGTCIDGIDAYDCDCHRGFEGRHCETEIDECRRFRPCAAGSTCVDQIGDYQCRCPPGIGGKNCTVQLRGCDQNDCENGATCVPYLLDETTHARNCSCPPGFYGPTCQFLTAMSFANDTHRLAVMGNSSHDYTLSLRFRTTLPDQLLAFGYGSSSLYYLLFLEDGMLRLWIQMSRSETTQLSFDQKTNDGQWWGLQLGFVMPGVNFTLGSSEKFWTMNQTVDFGGIRPTMTSTMIGGKDSWMRPAGGGDLSNFVGCMEDVEISGGMVVPGVEMAAAGVSSITYMGEVITGCVRTEQCFPSTCNGGGKCVDLWTAYSCSCFRPYFGLHCEHEYEAITFGHENSTESVVKVDITSAERQRLRNNATVSLFVRTRQSDGLIFYLGSGDSLDGAAEDDTFLAAEWESGVLRVSVKINGTPESLIDKLGRRLDDGYYHFLQVSLVNRTLSASINDTSLFAMEVEASQARYLEARHLYLGGLPSSHMPLLESEHQNHHHDIRRQIPTPSVITAAQSLPPSFMLPTTPHVVKVPFFKGVMQDVRINDWMVEVFESSAVEQSFKLQGNVTKRNVLRGVRSDDACRADPCQNGSNCTVTWNDYFCHCATGFRGKNCTELEFCASNKCPANSECHSLSHGYECIANATFNGINSSINYTPHLEPGLQFQSISFHFRSQHGGPVLYLSRGFLFLNVTLIGSSELKIESEERGSGTRIPLDLTDDGKWHFVNVTFETHSLGIQVDSRELGTTNVTAAWSLNQLLTPVGGDAFDDVQIVVGGSDSHYRGCLREVRLGDLLLPFFLRSELSNDSSVNYFAATAVENLKADECQLCYDDECQHNSICLDRHEHFHCNCSRGYEGQFCETDIDECAGVLCEHGGTCVDGIGAFTCHCVPGYQGDLCGSEVDECESNPCLHGGTCIDQLNAYSCTCDTNYTGINCEKEKPFDCSSNPCFEGATCVNTPKSTLMGVRFECHCPIGRTGHICDSEIDYCSADPCYNDATCINEPDLGRRRCSCQRGFEGDDCLLKTDYCKHSPCYHGATCTSYDEGYNCSCTAGYTGNQCEHDINECAIEGEEPCGTWGICNNTDGGFECLCPVQYIGHYCNVSNPCNDEMACQEHDVCSPSWFNDTYATPNCTCQGSSCKMEPDDSSTNAATLGIVVGSVVAATILIIIGVMTVFLTMAKKKRATRGTYSPSRQEMFGSRVEMGHVIKPPPEERLI